MVRTLKILDLRLEVHCAAPRLIAPFFAVFSPFAAAGGSPQGKHITVRIDDPAGTFTGPGGPVTLAPPTLRAAHVFHLLHHSVVREVEGVFLLHAAALARDGRALLIAGPSGSGKTSLAMALLQHGFRLLGDDVAPLDADTGRVHPFPRRVGLDAGFQGPGPADRDDAVHLGDKRFVAPEELGAPTDAEPLRPSAIVCMNPYAGASVADVPVTLGVLGDAGRISRRLEGVAGVSMSLKPGREGLTVIDLRLSGADAFAAVEEAIDGARKDLLFHVRGYGERKRYASRPELEPIPAREAAVELLREILNREPSTALMTGHGGQIGSALFQLIGLLRDVACFRLTPAAVEPTAGLIARTFDGLPD